MKSTIKKAYTYTKAFKKNKLLNKRKSAYFADLQDKYSLPKVSYEGRSQFSIVSAVYGVEKYLDKFIASVVKQTISFEKNIQLILVDDGSLDGSSEICKTWQAKFPDNIVYLRKENGGQASARNLGVKSAIHEWVSFADPDDFFANHYFERIDKFLSKTMSNDISLISCNPIFYYEGSYSFKNSHALKHKYNKGNRIVSLDDDYDEIQLFVNSALFSRKFISGLEFDDIKPNFEDGLFIAKFIIDNTGTQIAFLPHAKYFYRKRADQSSALDNAWENSSRYTTVLSEGYLSAIQYSLDKLGFVPNWLQLTIVYDTQWYFKYLVHRHSHQVKISEPIRSRFIALLKESYSHIDYSLIVEKNIPSLTNFYKQGVLSFLKGYDLPPNNIFIQSFDVKSSMVCLRFDSPLKEHLCSVLVGNKIAEPVYYKRQKYNLFESVFNYTHFMWVKWDEAVELKVKFNNDSLLNISFGNVNYKDFPYEIAIRKRQSLNVTNRVAKFYRKISTSNLYNLKYKNAWLLMDRDNKADDNAEHLYRYIKQSDKNENLFFILSKSSRDWSRLKKEGFNLIDFGSFEHIMALLNAEFIASSHADIYVTDLLNTKLYGDLLKYQFVFLQHGVIHNDLSEWLNRKSIRHFICSAQPEYDSIISNESGYKFTEREVALTGLPRHDGLLKQLNQQKRKMVIMPTWRQSLVGLATGIGNERALNEEFKESAYYKNWFNFISSKKLKDMAIRYNYEVVFFPHTNVEPYFKDLKVEHTKIMLNSDIDSIQELFGEMALMITDYSSVAFEFAYLKKPVLYYQFDRDVMFGGGHTTKPGYFDYFKNAFGPVCETEPPLFDEIEKVLANNCQPEQKYLNRMKTFFPFRDGNCSKRVYELMKGDSQSLLPDNH